MDTKSALYQLMSIRINDALDEIVKNDEESQQISKKSEKYLENLDAMDLPREAWLLIDRHSSEQNALGARYGALAYLLGFSDCIDLISAASHFRS